MGWTWQGIPSVPYFEAPVGAYLIANDPRSSRVQPGADRNRSANGALGMEERGLRMTKAPTSIKVYCSQVYSAELNTINQDLSCLITIFLPRRSGPLQAIPAIPAHGTRRADAAPVSP
jgi:hypothetical protein